MKKGKYIDHNILLACLSKKPTGAGETAPRVSATRSIVQEFYEALATPVVAKSAGLPGWRLRETAEPVCCS
jgi:hypothetical protein